MSSLENRIQKLQSQLTPDTRYRDQLAVFLGAEPDTLPPVSSYEELLQWLQREEVRRTAPIRLSVTPDTSTDHDRS
jgi:hypothetical protein